MATVLLPRGRLSSFCARLGTHVCTFLKTCLSSTRTQLEGFLLCSQHVALDGAASARARRGLCSGRQTWEHRACVGRGV